MHRTKDLHSNVMENGESISTNRTHLDEVQTARKKAAAAVAAAREAALEAAREARDMALKRGDHAEASPMPMPASARSQQPSRAGSLPVAPLSARSATPSGTPAGRRSPMTIYSMTYRLSLLEQDAQKGATQLQEQRRF